MEFPGVAEDIHVFANPPFAMPKKGITRRFGPGICYAGMIVPKDNETIVFEPGSYVYGCVFLSDVKGVKIVGRGVLDSSKMFRTVGDQRVLDNQMQNLRFGKGRWEENGSAFTALGAEDLYVDGITMVDSPFWTLILRDCRNTIIQNVKIVGQWRYNADGIDVCDSQDTIIRDSFIRSFDDCIVARGAQLESEFSVLDGLLVENCVLWCDWGKNLEVWGGGRSGAIRNVIYRGNACIETAHVVADVTVKGGAESISYENILVEGVEVDVVRPLMRPQLQRRENPREAYRGGERTVIDLAVVACYPGVTSGCNVRLNDIKMKNFRVYGNHDVALRVRADKTKPGFVLSGISFDGLPERTEVYQ